ncbi:MAG: sulfotransferase [Gammaproteobacteria bacterium]
MSATKSIWVERLHRRQRRLRIAWGDVRRALGWHIGGGRQFFERYFDEMRTAHRWCFIVGCNNSGTSLLQRILENTGQVSTLPYEGQLYTTVLERAMRRGHERVFMEYASALARTPEESVAVAPRLLHDWMRDLKLPIKDVILEKSPHNVLRMAWLDKVFPRCQFLCLVRNGFAVSEGIMRKGHKSAERSARHWAQVNRVMLKESVGVKSAMVLRYEDLVDSPEDTARRLANFLNLDHSAIYAAMNNQYSIDTIHKQGVQPIQNTNDKTIARLSVDDIKTIEREAGEMLAHFSYLDSSPRSRGYI